MTERPRMKVIYQITYPNGKIYIGKDLTKGGGTPKLADLGWPARLQDSK